LATDRQTEFETAEQMDNTDAPSCSRCRERRLNKMKSLQNIGKRVLYVLFNESDQRKF